MRPPLLSPLPPSLECGIGSAMCTVAVEEGLLPGLEGVALVSMMIRFELGLDLPRPYCEDDIGSLGGDGGGMLGGGGGILFFAMLALEGMLALSVLVCLGLAT